MLKRNLFQSFLMGGFECSTHRRGDGRRLDVVRATRHDEFARQDYERLIDLGMRVARDGIRWHLIEIAPYEYDFSSVLPQIRCARDANLQVIWDLFHYGYPDDLDILSGEFSKRFAALAGKFTELLISERVAAPTLCLVNEISFFAWIAGDIGNWHPFLRGRGDEVKRQLVKAAVAAAAAIKKIAPHAVLVQTDPIVNVVASEDAPANRINARNYHNAQFHALDMLLGKIEPEIGGNPQIIDAIGVNFYSDNQWRHPTGWRLRRGDADYKPFSEMLLEFYEHYRMPLFVAETGIENDERAGWFRYICDEMQKAIEKGVPVLGVCLYPVVNHPGWDDDRHCRNGLWCYPNERGEREIHEPLAEEIRRRTVSPKGAAAAGK